MAARSAVAFVSALAFGVAVTLPGDLEAADQKTPSAAPASVGALDKEHQRLASLDGTWRVTQSMWTSLDQAPAIDHGTATFSIVLGGRHLRQDLHVDAPGKPFDGVGYIGYDNATREYFSSWMDINFTGIILAHGEYDPASNTYTFKTSVPGGKNGAVVGLREVMHVSDKDHFTYKYFETHDGKESLAIELKYERKS